MRNLLLRPWAFVLAAAVASALACSTAELKQPSGGGPGELPTGTDDGGALPADDAGRDPTADLDGGSLQTSVVQIQVFPSNSGMQSIVDAIKGAKKSVHMTMYLLTSDAVIKALGDQKAAGKDVKVVLNQSFPPNGGSNQSSFNQLKARNVDVVWAPSAYTFTHAKTIIVDSEKVLVMTMNLTETSAQSNREFVATDLDPKDVADAEKVFAADHANTDVTVDSKLIFSPSNAGPVDPRTRLKALIDSARTSLDVEVQSLSDTALVDAIVKAQVAKVAVRVVIDANTINTNGQDAAIAKLKAAGVPLVAVTTPDVHAKAIVADGTAFVGSQNFTPTALNSNREVGLLTSVASEVAKVKDAIGKDFAVGSKL